METISSLDEFQKLYTENKITLAYFSHESCQVCHVLLPKVKRLLEVNFSKAKLIYCNTEKTAEVAAQNRIFTVPSILIFVDGKESYRLSRNISIPVLSQTISRPYQMMFD